MSRYEGYIRLRVRFAADNGYTADQALAAIATEIQDHWHDDLPRDDDGTIDEDQVFEDASSLIVGWTAEPPAVRA